MGYLQHGQMGERGQVRYIMKLLIVNMAMNPFVLIKQSALAGIFVAIDISIKIHNISSPPNRNLKANALNKG